MSRLAPEQPCIAVLPQLLHSQPGIVGKPICLRSVEPVGERFYPALVLDAERLRRTITSLLSLPLALFLFALLVLLRGSIRKNRRVSHLEP